MTIAQEQAMFAQAYNSMQYGAMLQQPFMQPQRYTQDGYGISSTAPAGPYRPIELQPAEPEAEQPTCVAA